MTTQQVWFRSGGKVYELAEVEQVSLRDIVTFPRQAAEVLGEAMTWAQFNGVLAEIMEMPPKERGDHPLSDFVLTVQVWISRRAAGETVTYSKCLDDPFEWVEYKVPQDRKSGKAKAAKKVAKKAAPKRPTPAKSPVSVPPDEPQASTA